MRSKKIVFLDEAQNQQRNPLRQSGLKRNVSAAKVLREVSSNKSKNISQNNKLSGTEKVSSTQKIKVYTGKDRFLFEKKYMIYDIQCLLKRQKGQTTTQKIERNVQRGQSEQTVVNDQDDYLILNIQSCWLGVTKGMVRHSFPIEKDNCTYVQVRILGYKIENIVISNKKIEYIALQNSEAGIDQQQITQLDPIKFMEQSQFTRYQKIKQYYQTKLQNKDKNKTKSRSYNFCWSLNSNVQNAQVPKNSNSKKGQSQNSNGNSNLNINHNNYINVALPHQMPSHSNRQSSKKKMFNSCIFQLPNPGNGHKTNRQGSQKISNLNQFMRTSAITSMNKQIGINKQKTSQRRILNDSNISNGSVNAIPSNASLTGKKQQKRQDAYGLQQIKKTKNKSVQNQQQNNQVLSENYYGGSHIQARENIKSMDLQLSNDVVVRADVQGNKYDWAKLKKII